MKSVIERLATAAIVALVAGVAMQPALPASSKSVSVEHFGAAGDRPLLILLHGVGGPSIFYREQAEFFAQHGYRVELPHYLEAGHGQAGSDANYAAWVAAVRQVLDDAEKGHPSAVFIVGYSLGASVALALGSQGKGPDAIAEFYGSLPDRYYRDLVVMPPLLILHGAKDTNIPVINAQQLSQLCVQGGFVCETHIYPSEQHGFSTEAMRDADQRTLQFFLKAKPQNPDR